MRLRRAIVTGLVLLLAAGTEVCNASAGANANASSSARPAAKPRVRRSRHSRRERGQKAPTPDRISEIQQALAKEGSFTGTPNGKWDASTAEAMRKYQSSHGLNPTGKLDALTLQKLGLGSKTAGVAAPVNSSSLTTPNSSQTAPQLP